MAKSNYGKTFSGGTFREVLMAYSCDRMDNDPQYRRDVRKAVSARRKARAASRAAQAAKQAESLDKATA